MKVSYHELRNLFMFSAKPEYRKINIHDIFPSRIYLTSQIVVTIP